MSGLIVLFDDERSFKSGFRDDAVVLRTVHAAEEFFESMKETGVVVDELWLDYVLSPGSTVDALPKLPGGQVKNVYYHSSAFAAFDLVTYALRTAGYEGEVDFPPAGRCFE